MAAISRLDRNFRVLVVGDPMRNLEIRNLYLKHILGMQPDWVKLETTAIVAKSNIEQQRNHTENGGRGRH